MKRIIGITVAIVVLGGAFFSILKISAFPDTVGDPFSSEELDLLQSGDLILRRGRGVASDLIINLLGESRPFSHVALLVNPEQEEPYVIQSISSTLSGYKGVHVQALNQFVKFSNKGETLVVRPQLNDTQRRIIIQLAHDLVREEVPFDHSFVLEDNSELYCSELISYLFSQIDFWSGENSMNLSRQGWIRFDSFWDNPGFLTIIDHRVQNTDYRY